MTTFGIDVLSNAQDGSTIKSTFVVYRCDLCGILLDNDYAKQHANSHTLKKAFNEAMEPMSGEPVPTVVVDDEVFEELLSSPDYSDKVRDDNVYGPSTETEEDG